MTRGSLPFKEHVEPQRLVEQLADALRRVHARNVSVTADQVNFTGGFFRFVSNWNVLVPFSRGELVINRDTRRLEYKVSYWQLVLFLVLFSVLFLAIMLASRSAPALIAVVLAMYWLVIGGMNVLIGRARFERFLRKTIDSEWGPGII